MAGRIVLFGATGYTGRLTARALVRRGVRPVLAARSERPLRELAAELDGLDTAIADVERPTTVRALVERGDVLISTVGPFLRFGRPALDAAIAAGAHYLDSTGEAPFIRDVFAVHGPRAAAAGCGLLTAFGCDWVPGNLAGALALAEAGDAAARVDVGYFLTGAASPNGMSGGTRASSVGVFLEPAHRFAGGALRLERGAARLRDFDIDGRSRPAFSLGASEQLALPRLSPNVRDVDVYLGWFGPLSRPLGALSAATAPVLALPGARAAVQRAIARLVPGSTGGPDAAQRSRSGTHVVAIAADAGGAPLATVHVAGPNGYDLTAALLAWGAQAAAQGELQGTGALGPADGFGLDRLRAGCAEAGLNRV